MARSYRAKLKTPERGGFELEFLHEDKKEARHQSGVMHKLSSSIPSVYRVTWMLGYLREMSVWAKSLLILIAGLTLFGRLDSWINLQCQSQV